MSEDKVVTYHFRDRNLGMVDAWIAKFKDVDGVTSTCGDIFDGTAADALVSPANSFGFMDGGIDGVYSRRFGSGLQDRLQALIHRLHDGELPVGQAQIVRIENDDDFRYLISAPTMRVPQDVSGTPNAYLAFRAVIRLVKHHNRAVDTLLARGTDKEVHYIESVLCPGLATAIGQMPYDQCANQMRRAYNHSYLGEVPRHEHLSFAAADIHYGDGIMTTRSPEIKDRIKFSTTNTSSSKKLEGGLDEPVVEVSEASGHDEGGREILEGS